MLDAAADVAVDYDLEPDGSVTFRITVPKARLRRAGDFRRYWFADVEKALPFLVDCDGYEERPRLILKLFCKLKTPQMAGVLRQKAIVKTLRSKSPVLY